MKTYHSFGLPVLFGLALALAPNLSQAQEASSADLQTYSGQVTEDSRFIFHRNRGTDGQGYTRFDGRRFGTGRNISSASLYSRGAARKRLGQVLTIQPKNREDMAEDAAISGDFLSGHTSASRSRYHKYSTSQRGINRYKSRRHFKENIVPRTGK